MRWFTFALMLVLGVGMPGLPSLAQEEDRRGDAVGRAEDIDEDESPVIVDDYPADEPGEHRVLRSEREELVQIQGAWAVDARACASAQGEAENGLYLTDTLIRWQEATCSIRDIEVLNGNAKIHAYCTSEGGRNDRTFDIRRTGEETLSLSYPAESGEQRAELIRCPSGQ